MEAHTGCPARANAEDANRLKPREALVNNNDLAHSNIGISL
jgi:hypothetical protein